MEILEARVIQKVGTEAEWLQNTLPLLDGEAAIVRTGDGTPVNLKFGDGGKTFAELPYFIDYSQAAYIAYTSSPTQPVAYTFVGEGTYGAITVAEGYMAVLGWDGTSWSKNTEIEMPVDTELSNRLSQGYFTIQDRGILKASGLRTTIANMYITDFIQIGDLSFKVKGYEGSTVSMVYFYDKFKQPISPLTGLSEGDQEITISRDVNIPSNAVYFISSCRTSSFGKIEILNTEKDIRKDSSSRDWNPYIFINKGQGILKTTGLVTSSPQQECTDFIDLRKNYSFAIWGWEGSNPSGLAAVYFYDKAKGPISALNVGTTSTSLAIALNEPNIPSNAKYFKVTAELNRGSVHLVDNNKNFIYENKLDKVDFEESFNDLTSIYSMTVSDSTVDKNTGQIIAASSVHRTSFIDISKANEISIKNAFSGTNASAVYFFTSTRRPISALSLPNGLHNIYLTNDNIPVGAKYIIATTNNTGLSTSEVKVVNSIIQNYISEGYALELASEYDSLFQKAANRQSEMAVRMSVEDYVPKWYGILWDTNVSNPNSITSTGDSSLHISLPIQSKIKRCIYKDGQIKYFLNDDNSELKADGTPSVLDGTDGDVMVYIPEVFYKIIETGSLMELRISEEPIPGYNYSPARLTSAYEAIIDYNDRLSSVCLVNYSRLESEIFVVSDTNYTKATSDELSLGVQKTATVAGYKSNADQFKGADGSTNFNSITDPLNNNVSKNTLGRPSSKLNRDLSRQGAKNKGQGARMYLYDTHKIIYILALVELKTLNFQNSVASGGLGKGATMYPNYNAAFNFYDDMRAIIPTGVTNSLGNKSGEVYYNMQNVPLSYPYGTWGDVWMPVMSYRGIENYFGHQYKSVDQINLRQYTVSGVNNDRVDNLTYFYQRNPFLTNNEFDRSLELVGSFTFNSYIKNIKSIVGGKEFHILPTDTTGNTVADYNTYFCDCCELKLASSVPGVHLKEVSFAGRYVSHVLCGPLFICSEGNERMDNPDYARSCNVTRLDYIIK